MKTLIAGVSSVVLALLINSSLPKVADSVFVPFIEELLKNGLAYLLNVSPLPVHLIFGLSEGLVESIQSKNLYLLGNALLGHGLYGAIAYLLWNWPLVGFLVAFLFHALYNTYVIKIISKVRSRK